jgi:hypothetical protein
MPAFAIIRTKKHKHIASIVGVARHHAREVACPTADPTKAARNVAWGAGRSASQTVGDKVSEVIAQAQAKAGKKFRADSVKAIEYLMSASPEWWKTATKEQRSGYVKRCRAWLQKKHGEGCVIAEWYHGDEGSPHLHCIVVPLHNGVLNAKHFLGGKARMRALQDDFAQTCGEPFGLVRGVAGSPADHVPVADWWAALNAPSAKPTKVDFAKAAIGIDVPAIELAGKQARAFDVQRRNSAKLRQRAVVVEKKALDVDSKDTYVSERERAANAKTDRLIELEKENMQLRKQLATLTPTTPGQGISLANLGL